MTQLLMTVFLAFISLFCLYVGSKAIIDGLSIISQSRKKNQKIKKWPRLIAKIRRVGYGIDYEFPYFEPNLDEVRGELAKEAALIEFQDNQFEALADVEAFGQVCIEYTYEKDGQQWLARAVGPYVSDKDIELFYKIKVGNNVKAYVNPSDGTEAYLRVATKKELDEYANKMLLSNLQYFIYALLAGALSYLSIGFVFPF